MSPFFINTLNESIQFRTMGVIWLPIADCRLHSLPLNSSLKKNTNEKPSLNIYMTLLQHENSKFSFIDLVLRWTILPDDCLSLFLQESILIILYETVINFWLKTNLICIQMKPDLKKMEPNNHTSEKLSANSIDRAIKSLNFLFA